MATTPAESSLFKFTYPPLGWHRSHTQWQIRPLGHLSNAEQPSSVQTKPLRQAAQLVGLPAELGDGSGFSNFVDTTDTTSPIFGELQSKFQKVSPTPQPDIQPLWQKAADLSQSSFQITQPADSPLDNKDAITDPISEPTTTPTIDRSTNAEAKDTSSAPLPTVNPLQRQPLGQHHPLGFNPPFITDTSAAISPAIQPKSAETSLETDTPLAQQSQNLDDVTSSIDPDTELISEHLNRTEISSADAVADTPIAPEATEAVDNLTVSPASETATPVQRSLSTQSSDVEFPNDLEAAPQSDNRAPLDVEPEQDKTGVADSPLTTDLSTPDIAETVVPVQRAPAGSPDIEPSTDRLVQQVNDIPPIEVTPEFPQPPDTGEIVQDIAPVETTEISSNMVSEVTEQSQPSLQPSSPDYSEPDAASEFSTADIASLDVSPPIQPTTEVVQPRTEQVSEIQPASDPFEAFHRSPENPELPPFEDNSTPVDTAQVVSEISTQEFPAANEPDDVNTDVNTASLADIQAQPAIMETPSVGSEPTETFQPLESVQPDLLQEPTISEPSAPEPQRLPQVSPPEQVIQQGPLEVLPTDETLPGVEIKSSPSEQSPLDTRAEQEQFLPAFPPEKPQIIPPGETPSSQTEVNLPPQLQPSSAPSTPSDNSPSLFEPESSDIQDVLPQSLEQLSAELPAIQAKLPSAPAIQPLGMHELMIDALKDSPDPLTSTALPEATDLSHIHRKQSQEQTTLTLSPKLTALTSKYGLDEPDDSFWSSDPLTSSGVTSLLDLETPVETDSIESDPFEAQTQTVVSLSVPDAIAEMVEGGKSAHVSSGESEDQALWQLAYVLYSELRNDRGVRSRLTSSTFQRASPGLMPIQSEQNPQPHLPLALWPPPMHQLATAVRLQLQTRLRQDFERSAWLSKFG